MVYLTTFSVPETNTATNTGVDDEQRIKMGGERR